MAKPGRAFLLSAGQHYAGAKEKKAKPGALTNSQLQPNERSMSERGPITPKVTFRLLDAVI